MRRILPNLLKYGISLLCLLYAFKGVPLAELWQVLQGYPILPMLGAVAVSFAAYAIMGLRLTRANEPPLSFSSAFCAALVGLAINNVLPAKAGEVAKAAWIGRANSLGMDKSLGIIFMERFFDVNVLALLSMWFLLQTGRGGVALLFIGCLLFGWIFLFAIRYRPGLLRFIELIPLPHRITGFIVRFLQAISGQLILRRLLWMSVSSLALWLFYATQMGFVLDGVAGLGLTWGEVLGVFAISSLGMLLPSSPGAVGVYEAVAVTALKAYGVPHSSALAVALFAHMVQFIPVTLIGGAVFLFFPVTEK